MEHSPDTPQRPAESAYEQIKSPNRIEKKQAVLDSFLEKDLSFLQIDEQQEYIIKEAVFFLYEELPEPIPPPPEENQTEARIHVQLAQRAAYSKLFAQEQKLVQLFDIIDTVTAEQIPTLLGILSAYLKEHRQYTELLSAQKNPEQQQIVLNEQDSDQLKKSLGLPPKTAAAWEQILREAQGEIPEVDPALASKDEKRAAYLSLQYEELQNAKTGLQEMLYLVARSLRDDEKPDPEMQTLLLGSISAYLKRKEVYLYTTDRESKASSRLAAFAAMTAQEGVEEGIEEIIDKLTGGSLTARIKLVRGMHGLKLQLIRNGVRTSVLQQMLSGNNLALRLTRESIKTLTPNGVGSLLVMMYYLHVSEDKTRAFMMYSSFLTAGKGLDGLGTALSKFTSGPLLRSYPKAAKHLARLGKIKGVPIGVKFAVLMLAAYGLGDDLNEAIDWIESRSDPFAYDLAGNIMGALEAPIDLVQATGLGGADPLKEQKMFLDWQPSMTKNTGFGVAAAQKRMQWWDELVEEYANEEKNPIRRELIRLESIEDGPGGRKGWEARQALEYYGDWRYVQQVEQRLNATLAKKNLPSTLGLSTILNNEEDANGDRNVRYKLVYDYPYNQMHSKFDEAIDAADSKKEKEEIQKIENLYSQYITLARQVDKDRSMYVRLGVFSKDWIEENPNDDMPTSAKQGMMSEIMYQAKRKEALNTVVDGRKLAEILEEENFPSPTLDPMGFLSYFMVTGNTWQKRIDEERYRSSYLRLAGAMSKHMGKEQYSRVFEPLQEVILQQREKGIMDSRQAMGILGAAYAEQYDGRLKPQESGIEGSSEKTFSYSTATPEYLHIRHPNFKEIDTEQLYEKMPMIVHTEEFWEGDDYKRLPGHDDPECYISTVTHFGYDANKDEWAVHTNNYVLATTNYIGKEAAGRSNLKINAQTRVSHQEPFRVWRQKHPKFAVQLFPAMQQYKQEVVEWEQNTKTEEERRLRKTINSVEAIRLEAKEKPNRWHAYGHKMNPLQKEDAYIFDFVAYDKDHNRWLYIQEPDLSNSVNLSSPDTIRSRSARTFVRVADENGVAIELNLAGDWEHYLTKSYENGAYRQFASSFKQALTIPHEQTEYLDSRSADRKSLINLLTVYADRADLQNGKYDSAIEEILDHRQYFETPERSALFLRYLLLEITYATRNVQKEGTASKNWRHLTPSMFREIAKKAREKNYDEF